MKTFTIDWLNKCRCGNKSHTVKTARGNETALWDDDAVKCNSCGRGGVIQVCEGQARVLWETDEEMADGKPMTTITKERLLTIKQWRETYGPGSNVVLPAEETEELARIALASLERELIRHEHAKWSDSTFGCVGPIGPLKHLSKEALEAAAEPDDLSEWADMHFLLLDAQRRAGISDAEITAAMEDKLKINMERQWPEPKDGEPRLHIKEPGNSPVIPDGLSTVCAEAYQVVGVMADALGVFGDAAVQKVLDNLSQQKLVHKDVLPFSLPVTPDGWISCSDRMPEKGQNVLISVNFDSSLVEPLICSARYTGSTFRRGDATIKPGNGIEQATHWMPLPEPPQEVK